MSYVVSVAIGSKKVSFFFFLNSVVTFIYIYISAALGLHWCTRTYSSCSERGLFFVVQASHCGGFSYCGAQGSRAQASVVVAHRLSSCSAQALERKLSSCGVWV